MDFVRDFWPALLAAGVAVGFVPAESGVVGTLAASSCATIVAFVLWRSVLCSRLRIEWAKPVPAERRVIVCVSCWRPFRTSLEQFVFVRGRWRKGAGGPVPTWIELWLYDQELYRDKSWHAEADGL